MPRRWSSIRTSPWRCSAWRTVQDHDQAHRARPPGAAARSERLTPSGSGSTSTSPLANVDGKRRERRSSSPASSMRSIPTDPRSVSRMLARDALLRGNRDEAITDLRGAARDRPEQRRGLQPDRLLLRLPRRLREGDREPQEVPVHLPRQRQPVRLPRREPGLLGPLQRGDREPEPGARDQAGLRPAYRAPRRRVRGHGRLSEGDRDVREGRDARRRRGPASARYLTRALRAATDRDGPLEGGRSCSTGSTKASDGFEERIRAARARTS